MAMERTGITQSKGRYQTAVGPNITVGIHAPDLVAIGHAWSGHYPIREERGKVLVLTEVA